LNEDTYYGDGLNLYAYCHNNPVGYIDPSGHICEDKYAAIESIRKEHGLTAEQALNKYKELRNSGMSAQEIRKTIENELIKNTNDAIKAINSDFGIDDNEKTRRIVELLKNIGFNHANANTVNAFTERNIEIVKMDGSETLYRRSWDTEGTGEYGYGSWWADHSMSIDEARNDLAILEVWGNPLTGQYEAQPNNTFAMKGTAAEQKEGGEYRAGGAVQYY
jgi:hypothetical protein